MIGFDHQAIAAMADEFRKLAVRQNNALAREIELLYPIDLAYAQFVNGHLREAPATLHPVINDHRPGFRDDLLCIARLFRLMVRYDLEEIGLLPYPIRSTCRFITRCRGVSGVDRVVLRFMRRLPNISHSDDLMADQNRIVMPIAGVYLLWPFGSVSPRSSELSEML